MKKRDCILNWFLIMFTLGFYSVKWMLELVRDTNTVCGRKVVPTFLPIVYLVSIALAASSFAMVLYAAFNEDPLTGIFAFSNIRQIYGLAGLVYFISLFWLVISICKNLKIQFGVLEREQAPKLWLAIALVPLWLLALPYLQSHLNQLAMGESERQQELSPAPSGPET